MHTTRDRPAVAGVDPRRARAASLLLLLSACLSLPAQGQSSDGSCGNPFVNGFGPYDYRRDVDKRKIVEDFHFTARVEALIAGVSATVGQDLDYTLRAFPNHHRALVAMMNLGNRTRKEQPPGAQFSVDCYFRRAVQFRPDDQVSRLLYARFLAGSKRQADALVQVDKAIEGAQDNALTQYNAGLVLLEMGEHDRAVTQAHRAAALGLTRADLETQLRAAGKWRDAPPAADAAASASASAASAPAPAPTPAASGAPGN